MMNHFSKDGTAKLLKKCILPLTGKEVVDVVVTEMGVFKPNGKSFETLKLAPGITLADLKIDSSILK